jgi:signal transduction histidine kinase
VLELEAGQRGFVLTRQAEYLDSWDRAREALPREGSALLELVRGDHQQERRVRELIAAARSYIDDYSVPLVNAAQKNDPSAKTVAATAEGEARVKAIRTRFARLLDTEHSTSLATERESAAAARRTFALVVIGIAVCIVLVVLYASYISRAIVGPIRRAAAVTTRLGAGDLAARMSETGVGEIGALQQAFNHMGASLEQGRDELAALADEQSALRRVATLVAQSASPDEVLAAVAAEIGQLLLADYVGIARYGPGGQEAVIVGNWKRDASLPEPPPILPVEGQNLAAVVWQTGDPATVGPDEMFSDDVRALAVRSAVGVPTIVEGQLWGVVIAASSRDDAFPNDTETRLGSFTELVSTAIANAEAHAALTASRARIVTSSDDARRRFERDLHDGAQQHLIKLAMQLRAIHSTVPTGLNELATDLDDVIVGLRSALDELRELASGIHPPVLSQGGLVPALKELGRRAATPVDVELHIEGRAPEAVEIAAYFVVSEALANAAKYARATAVTVRAATRDEVLTIVVCDDGIGGADFGRGTGLVGLRDRVEALGGRIALQSNAGEGTSLSIELPLTEPVAALP